MIDYDGDDSFEFPEETKHFKDTRIAWMLKSASYYLHPVPSTKLEGYYFSCLFNIKNYDNEIETFVEWLTPYIDDYSDFLGYKIYEEDEKPTLLYHPNKWV